MKPLVKDPARMVSDPRVQTVLVRLAMLLVLVGSVWLVVWSFSRFTQVNRQLNQKSSAAAALADEVQTLERKSDAHELARTEARFKDAQESLFAGSEDVAAWLKALPEKTLALGLEATVHPSQTNSPPRTTHKLLLSSTWIDLGPTVTVGVTSYQRLVDWIGLLQRPKQRIDLLELVVIGNSNSVRYARAQVQLWSQEGKPE